MDRKEKLVLTALKVSKVSKVSKVLWAKLVLTVCRVSKGKPVLRVALKVKLVSMGLLDLLVLMALTVLPDLRVKLV